MTEETTKFLTKAELLAGKDTVVEVSVPEFTGKVKIRPLTASEYAKITNKKLNGLKPASIGRDGKPQYDLSQTMDREFEGDSLMISMAMAGEPWTIDEVKGLKQSTFTALVEEINFVSGTSKRKKEQVAEFRKE